MSLTINDALFSEHCISTDPFDETQQTVSCTNGSREKAKGPRTLFER